uniref:Putative secreted peptide n=1 Tax=Anopheles braziliensis TaxID=58242 RepID=A0A2M3ZXC8_9DIPT
MKNGITSSSSTRHRAVLLAVLPGVSRVARSATLIKTATRMNGHKQRAHAREAYKQTCAVFSLHDSRLEIALATVTPEKFRWW